MKDICLAKTLPVGLAFATILFALFSGCQDLIFQTPDFDNPNDPKNSDTPQVFGIEDVQFRAMVQVPGGAYDQQATFGDLFEHTVSPFEIARYAVTYELWFTVRRWAEANGYEFENLGQEGSRNNVGVGGMPSATGRHQPVTSVSWRDAVVWLNAYSEMEGLTPAYYTEEATAVLRSSIADAAVQTSEGSIDNPYVDWAANGYRLPTEGEWQYAASYQDGALWTPHNYASGAAADFNDAFATGAVAWYDANTDRTQPVGTRDANQLGIHDMSGNATEWIWDWRDTYPVDARSDYRGPEAGSERILRGGSWSWGAFELQTGYRPAMVPWFRGWYTGLRPARTL